MASARAGNRIKKKGTRARMDIILKLKDELKVEKWQVEAAVKLIDEGNTIPFISRYRKEATGSLNDEAFPTIGSTGLEDYFGGSWSFAKYDKDGKMTEDTYNTLYMGYPFYSRDDDLLKNPYHNTDVPPMRVFYRFHIPDPVFFEENIKVTVQQIGASYKGLFERQDDYTSVAYWYQNEPHNAFTKLKEAPERWPR